MKLQTPPKSTFIFGILLIAQALFCKTGLVPAVEKFAFSLMFASSCTFLLGILLPHKEKEKKN